MEVPELDPIAPLSVLVSSVPANLRLLSRHLLDPSLARLPLEVDSPAIPSPSPTLLCPSNPFQLAANHLDLLLPRPSRMQLQPLRPHDHLDVIFPEEETTLDTEDLCHSVEDSTTIRSADGVEIGSVHPKGTKKNTQKRGNGLRMSKKLVWLGSELRRHREKRKSGKLENSKKRNEPNEIYYNGNESRLLIREKPLIEISTDDISIINLDNLPPRLQMTLCSRSPLDANRDLMNTRRIQGIINILHVINDLEWMLLSTTLGEESTNQKDVKMKIDRNRQFGYVISLT